MKHTSVKHYSCIGALVTVLSIVVISCSNKKITTVPIATNPIDKEAFIIKPFGYEPSIKNFKANLPSSFKLQVYSMKNIHNPTIIDTIYNFHQKNSKFLVYKNRNNRELFFAGNIYTDKIQLQNGIRVGISRADFYKRFNNLKPDQKDTIRISSKKAPNSINFIFKNDKLSVIKIDNYID
jgi:hypothetical protein